jgi:cyclic-di-GMP phosphodiesterase, flagellum assembly factor TipF
LRGRGFRFIKVPAALLLGRDGFPKPDTDPADLSGMLGGFGVDLVAERIESENVAADVLKSGVPFGQGNLFAPPRPVRAEALQGGIGEEARPAKAETNGQVKSDSDSAGQPKSSADLLAAAANASLSGSDNQAARPAGRR